MSVLVFWTLHNITSVTNVVLPERPKENEVVIQKQEARGSIEVRGWNPAPFGEVEGATSLVQIDVAEIFHGDIEGEGTARLLQALRSDGTASFVGLERVTATLAGKSGTFVFQDSGSLDASQRVDGTWFVVPGSGTGELAGLRGEGSFTAELGQNAVIALSYWFE
jgi:hypothetical protein